jgi:hypothetical protein
VLGTIGSHALRAGRTLHDSSLLDRLLRGRGWVAVLGALLIGLVALNVSLLKLNAQAGRNAAAARELRISNAELNGKVTRLASAERLQRAGERLGMVPASAGAIKYLRSRGRGDGKLAATQLERNAQAAPLLATPPVTDTTTDPAATVTPDPAALATPETTEVPVTEPTTTDDVTAPVTTEPDPGTG